MADPDSNEETSDNTPNADPPPHPREQTPGREGLESDLRASGGSPLRGDTYEPVTLRQIDWAAAFPFTNLFRGFRLAVHPSKLLLALTAVLLLYTGGRILDGLWMEGHKAVPGEAGQFDEHVTLGRVGDFADYRREGRRAMADDLAIWREDVARVSDAQPADIDIDDVKDHLIRRRDRVISDAKQTYENAVERLAQSEGADARVQEQRRQRDASIRAAYLSAARDWEEISQLQGRGLFAEFYEYETTQFNRGLDAVLRLDAPGLLGALYRVLYVGPLWGFSQHPLYFCLFFLLFLTLAAVFGGAICRIASVQVARDEKISLRSALRFSTGKFVSFLSAPLIPVLIIGVIALLVAIAGMLGNIPYLGELVLGAGFIFALIAGFLITLVLIGLLGGFSLMYPTIAAEGTDSFDAISRSFSYLYAKPWRLAFYAIVAIIYGAITYLFVRLFVWLMLVSSHVAASLFIWRDAAGHDDVLTAMWPPPPTYRELSYDIAYINLNWMQDLSATLLAFWVYLAIAMVAAYAVSLYYSLATMVYFLMRREVDATELDDVYLDPHDEEFAGYSDVPEADTDAPIEPAPVSRQ